MQRAKITFYASQEGAPERLVKAGDLLPDNDSIIKGREGLFEDVEDATAPIRHSSPVQTAPKAEKKPEKAKPDNDDDTPPPAKKAAPAKRTRRGAKKAAPAKKAAKAEKKPEPAPEPSTEPSTEAPSEKPADAAPDPS